MSSYFLAVALILGLALVGYLRANARRHRPEWREARLERWCREAKLAPMPERVDWEVFEIQVANALKRSDNIPHVVYFMDSASERSLRNLQAATVGVGHLAPYRPAGPPRLSHGKGCPCPVCGAYRQENRREKYLGKDWDETTFG